MAKSGNHKRSATDDALQLLFQRRTGALFVERHRVHDDAAVQIVQGRRKTAPLDVIGLSSRLCRIWSDRVGYDVHRLFDQ